MDRLDLYRTFIHVVESRSFTIASERLGVSRSSVSIAIAELESRIGARLLYRTTRRVSPTSEGQTFYQHCLELIAANDQMEAMFRRGQQISGQLRVDVPSRIGQAVIMPALDQFLGHWPQVQVDLRLNDREVDLVADSVDVAVRMGQVSAASLHQIPLRAVPQINVASPAYLARYGLPNSPDDLGNHLQVAYTSPTTGRIADWEWMQDGQSHHRPVPWRVAVSHAEAYIAAALHGYGLIQIPAYDVAQAVASGALVEVMPDHRPAPMQATVLSPHPDKIHPRTQVFVDWLVPLLNAAFLRET